MRLKVISNPKTKNTKLLLQKMNTVNNGWASQNVEFQQNAVVFCEEIYTSVG